MKDGNKRMRMEVDGEWRMEAVEGWRQSRKMEADGRWRPTEDGDRRRMEAEGRLSDCERRRR